MQYIHRTLAAVFVLFLAAVAAQAQGPVLQLTTDAGTPLFNNSSYNYGTLLAGNSTQNSLRVRNIGNQTLTLSVTLSGGSGVFAVDYYPSSLGPGASDVIILRFSGSLAGTFTGNLTVTSNDTSHNPVGLSLAGTIAASPAAIPSVRYNFPSPVAKVVPGDAFDIGSATSPGFITRDFSIQNIGSSTLNLTNLATIFNSCPGFSFTQTPPSSLTATSSAGFTIKFQQTFRGTYSCTVSFAHNGAGNNPLSFTITAHTLAPVLVVSSGGTQIFNNAPALNMGSTPLGSPISKVFTITNNGDATLSLSGLSSGSSAFTISGFPFSVAAGSSANFTVTFKALNAGTYNSQYSFGTSDPQFPSFNLNVQATGVGPAMTVTDPGGAVVPNGSTYAYGSTPQGVSTSRLFTISNSGNAALTISNFALSNPGGGYSILASPAASVAGPGSTTFRIRLLSNFPGSYSATVTFNTNDPNFPAFTLNLTGTVTSTAGNPTIRVTAGDGTNIPNGGSFTFPATTLGTAVSRAFLIYNDGTADLILSNPTGLVSGTGFAQGQVPPTTPIPPGGNSMFRVNLTAAARGTFNGTVTIQSNDTAHTPFTFAVHGTVN